MKQEVVRTLFNVFTAGIMNMWLYLNSVVKHGTCSVLANNPKDSALDHNLGKLGTFIVCVQIYTN